MRVTFSVEDDIYEREDVDDVEFRKMNGDWCLKIDGVVEYAGEAEPEVRVQSE